MAKNKTSLQLAPETMVELVGVKGEKSVKKEMTYQSALMAKKEYEVTGKWRGWRFIIYQLGFSQFRNKES